MAQLAFPTIEEPVSPLVQSLRLHGLEIGASVQVVGTSPKSNVVLGTASSSSQSFALLRPLVAGEQLFARQYDTMNDSGLPDAQSAITVMKLPTSAADLGPPGLVSHVYACGQCLWLDGVYPGASVQVLTAANSPRSSPTQTETGDARLLLTQATLAGDQLVAVQKAAGFTGPMLVLPLPDVITDTHGDLALPPPTIDAPLFECQTSIAIDDAVDGANVYLVKYNPSQPPVSKNACFDVPGLWFPTTPLAPDDQIEAYQRFPTCDVTSVAAGPIPVTAGVPTPAIASAPCQGDTTLLVTGCVPGATLSIVDVDTSKTILLAFPSSGSLIATFSSGVLSGVATIAAKQALCGHDSALSSAVVVSTSNNASSVTTQFVEPVMVCAAVVRITGTLPAGTSVRIYSQKWSIGVPFPGTSPAIGQTYVTTDSDHVDVPIFPPLAGDTLFVYGIRCGTIFPAGMAVVHGLTQGIVAFIVPPPTLTALDCQGVRATNIVPGARVDYYADGVYYTTLATPTSTAPLVPLPATAIVGKTVITARQRVCGGTSAFSSGVIVTAGSVKVVDLVNVCAQITSESALIGGTSNVAKTARADLGIPVCFGGELLFFFGDSDAFGDKDVAKPIYKTTATPSPCVTLVSPLCSSGSTDDPSAAYHRLRVAATDQTTDGRKLFPFDFYEVPSGGFAYDGNVYVFVTKLSPGIVSGTLVAPENVGKMGSSYLLSAPDYCSLFSKTFAVDDGANYASGTDMRFINVAARVINNAEVQGLPSTSGDGLLLWGTGPYRQSALFLAWTSLTPGQPIPNPSEWYYQVNSPPFTVNNPPKFERDAQQGMKQAVPIFENEICGEISVAFISEMRKWLFAITSNGAGGGLFLADAPWGPLTSIGAPTWQVSDSPPDILVVPTGSIQQCSGLYGNYIIEEYNTWDPELGIASVFLTSSIDHGSCDFYGVYMLRLRLSCN
jgi:hypothetical protein